MANPSNNIIALLKSIAEINKLPPLFVLAIAKQESNYNPYAARYEPAWRYHLSPRIYASNLGITLETELILQAISWGPLQVMGTVARELGFKDHLTKLAEAETAIHYGCLKLKKLMAKYADNLPHVAAAYNAGAVRQTDGGLYINQRYVDNVMRNYREEVKRSEEKKS